MWQPVVFSLLLALVAVLGSCSHEPSRTMAPIPQYNIPSETWRSIDEQIIVASVDARHESEAYARIVMSEWLWRVRQTTEGVFIPWYSSYMTQQWLATKVAWYRLWYTGGGPTPEDRLVDYLQDEFYEQVLEPVSSFVDPRIVMVDVADSYLREFACRLDVLPYEYDIPVSVFERHLESIPAIVVRADSLLIVSLYEALQVGDIASLPACVALLSQTPAGEGVYNQVPLSNRLHVVARSAVTELADSLMLRSGTTAASSMVGGAWGVIIYTGATIWDVTDHNNNKPEMERQLHENLDVALDAVWQGLVEDQKHGVMALVHHMATQVEAALFLPPQINNLPAPATSPASEAVEPDGLF